MKRLLRSLLLAAVLTAALCVGALAAEPTVAGIYGVTDGNGVTLTPQTAGQSVITTALIMPTRCASAWRKIT